MIKLIPFYTNNLEEVFSLSKSFLQFPNTKFFGHRPLTRRIGILRHNIQVFLTILHRSWLECNI